MGFDDLPRELWQLIFSYLNTRDLMTLCFVSHSAKQLGQNNTLWKARCEAVLPAFQVKAHASGEWFLFFKSQYPRPSDLLKNLAIYKRYEIVNELGKLKEKDIQEALDHTHEMSAIKWLKSL